MFLGIEIGGTKLQLAIGPGDGTIACEPLRLSVDRAAGAAGIMKQINDAAGELISRHSIERVGIGFGGPIDAAAGRTIKSHQVGGWEDVALVDWCRNTLGAPCVLGNDAD